MTADARRGLKKCVRASICVSDRRVVGVCERESYKLTGGCV